MLGKITSLLPGLCWHRLASSQFNGVYWNKAIGKYHAQVCFKGDRKHAGCFLTEQQAAHAYDALLRALCDDGRRLKRSLNFPTPLEASAAAWTEQQQQESRRRALATYSQRRKEDESFDRLRRLFDSSPQAQNYEILRVSGSSKVDALFQRRGSISGGVALQLKSASLQRQRYYSFNNTRGYAGMLLMLLALDSDAVWALPGASVTRTSFFITSGSSRDAAFQVDDVGLLLESCLRNRKDFPHVSLAEARVQCSPNHHVEEQAHALLATMFHRVSYELEKSFTDSPTVDSVLAGEACRWRVQEKSSTLQADFRYSVGLWKHGGALGKLAYSEDDFDLVLAALLDDGRLSGLFVFPADALARLGYIGQKPCHLPLHPPWRLPKREDTRVKHAWQLEYFVDLRKWDAASPLPFEVHKILENILRRLAACQEKSDALLCTFFLFHRETFIPSPNQMPVKLTRGCEHLGSVGLLCDE